MSVITNFPASSGGGKIETLTNDVESLKEEIKALKSQIGPFTYLGKFTVKGNSTGETTEITIQLENNYGVYLLFTSQNGSWSMGGMIFIDMTDAGDTAHPTSSFVNLSNSQHWENGNMGIKLLPENRQIIMTNKTPANYNVYLYKMNN